MMHFVAVAVSATESIGAVVAHDGRVTCMTHGDGFIPGSWDHDRLQIVLHVLLNDLDQQLKLLASKELEQVTGVHVSADVGFSVSARKMFEEAFASTFWKALPLTVYDRGRCSLQAALGRDEGALLKCGTSTFAFLIRGDQSVRVGGWSPMVDGDGGAYSIGRAALNAVLRSYDETGAIDEFGEIVLTAMASRSIDECLRWTCRLGSAAAIHTGISELSKVVMAAQVRGNDRARSLLDQGAEQAVRLLEIGLNRCPLGESFDLGLYGGVVQYSEYIAKALHDSLRSRFPRARVQLAAARPLAGVVWSVLEPLGHSDFHKWLSSAAEGVPASQRGFLLPSFAYSLSQ